MYRDISSVNNYQCNVIVDNQTIATYSGTQVRVYKLVSNKYYLNDTVDYSGLPTTLNCLTHDEISVLPSNYDFIMPIFYIMAIFSSIFIFYSAYRLVIYPWFRRHL